MKSLASKYLKKNLKILKLNNKRRNKFKKERKKYISKNQNK
jgi:hypothetical protein